jgi:hypothetical protein
MDWTGLLASLNGKTPHAARMVIRQNMYGITSRDWSGHRLSNNVRSYLTKFNASPGWFLTIETAKHLLEYRSIDYIPTKLTKEQGLWR